MTEVSRTPAEMLVAAADRIRDLAAVWEAENAKMAERRNKGLAALHAEYGRAYTWDEVAGFVVDEYSDKALDAGAAWIAALSPDKAPLIERGLRAAAEEYEADDHYRWMRMHNSGGVQAGWNVSGAAEAALALAEAVLGSEVDTHG